MSFHVVRRAATCVVLSVGCAGALAAPAGPDPLQPRVTGSVTWLERVALPAGAAVRVALVDVSRADAPATVLGEQVIETAGRQPPFRFAIAYDPARVEERFTYALQARIENGGRPLFVNDRRYTVLTRGAPRHADMVLKAVGGAVQR